MNQSKIGVVGLAVMGRNLAYNFASHGYITSVYNRTFAITQEVLASENHPNLIGYPHLKDFVNSLEKPRKIVLMIKSGDPIDKMIETLLPHLEPGDILIDGGNSYFKDTQRRSEALAAIGYHYFGLGVSGGEEGARFGPALMPGGDKSTYEVLRPLLESIAAKFDDDPCCKYTAIGGAGHYVKMVHNGIEYADMQIIAEAYDLLKNIGKFNNLQMASIFETYNKGPLNSYLIEITGNVLREKDDLKEGYLLDSILDVSGQKETGKWTNMEAISLSVDASVLSAGLNARFMSMDKTSRENASTLYPYLDSKAAETTGLETLVGDALLMSKIIAYAQGFKLLREAGIAYNWDLNFRDIASTFRAGCIIRSSLLQDIMAAYSQDTPPENLMLDTHFSHQLNALHKSLRNLVGIGIENEIATPALSAALTYFDAYRRKNSPANLIQAQRDFFGAHTYQRNDKSGIYHHKWSSVNA